jgi:Family of unknown function (DUF5985)
MMFPHVLPFLAGAVTLGYGLCGVGFLRLWSSSRDRFFLVFAVAFWLLMLPAFSALWGVPEEDRAWVYVARIAAYTLISVAIIGKNRGRFRIRRDAAEAPRGN